jgi:hypothetical protein
MYLRLAGENPFALGNSARKSTESWARTLLPQSRLLSLDDRRSDLPVQPEQFGVDATLGDVARLMHKPFDALERGCVVGGDEGAHSLTLMEATDRLAVAGCSADGDWGQGLLESFCPPVEPSSGTFRVRPHREKPEELTTAMLGYSSLDSSSRSARSRSR